ncbi:MAG: hypothetical protein A3G91_02230 [Omnitrophica WOR_2 bacterium RIFCSPLOWO2_12_FULL_50_9]|nr:MAG: hypothetical protein A3G91_02230 [Omnitrophica WOR_2 bacterium RIFCSPLOWO2_12_FULL_50_9]
MCRVRRKHIYSLLLCLGVSFLLAGRPVFSSPGQKVHIIQLNDDTINPVTAEYIAKSIDKAYNENAGCLIIKLDTPGGLLSSTRLIVKKILASKIPVVVYIAPSGSRAGSAGVFIAYASHVAAMAPSTNIGAAHPVAMGWESSKKNGEWREMRELIEELREAKKEKLASKDSGGPADEIKEDKPREEKPGKKIDEEKIVSDEDPMSSKILQDTVAFIRAIAKERGRNIEWAVESVVKSASITDKEALEKGVVEIIAKDERDLIEQIDGRTIELEGKDVILHTKEASLEYVPMGSSQKFFNVLANPTIAYILMIIGFYGLLFEITHPGIGVPGVAGAIFLILAFYSMQTLPTNYAGLALLILGLVLLIAEAYTPAFGLLTLGGLVCMILGSMLLFESVDPIMRVSKSVIYAFSLTTAAITFFLLQSVIRTHRSKVHGGREGLIGSSGEAQTSLNPKQRGRVFIHGEIWNATSDEEIKKGEEVVVTDVTGLMLKVRKK